MRSCMTSHCDDSVVLLAAFAALFLSRFDNANCAAGGEFKTIKLQVVAIFAAAAWGNFLQAIGRIGGGFQAPA